MEKPPIEVYPRAGEWICDEGNRLKTRHWCIESAVSYGVSRAGWYECEVWVLDRLGAVERIIPKPQPHLWTPERLQSGVVPEI